ncbi:MAG: DUF4124 domain-containing protein [Burkholderiaceae bacterium]
MSTMRCAFKLVTVCLALGSAAVPATAQTIYRVVGPDGRVTFSDKPPVSADAKAMAPNAGGRASGTPENAALPYELRQVATRYPVTLYASINCVPCNAGRLMLQARGIPYVEHAIATQEDNEALKRLSGDSVLPFLTIGGQKIKGYSEAEWSQFLNAASYPQTSVLPPTFRHAAAKPLVTVQKPAPAKSEEEGVARVEEKPANSRPTTPPPPTNSNPAGIRF